MSKFYVMFQKRSSIGGKNFYGKVNKYEKKGRRIEHQ